MQISGNEWTTNAVRRRKAIDYWNELLTEKVIGLDVCSDTSDGFQGRIIAQPLARQHAYMISARHNQRAIHRTDTDTCNEEVYILIHMRSGEFHLSTPTANTHLKMGDSVLLSATETFQFACPEKTSSLVLRFEQAWLKKWLPVADDCIGQHIDGQRGWGQTLSSALWNIEPSKNSDWSKPPAYLADQVAGLLGLALEPKQQTTSSACALVRRIVATLRNEFEDPLLNPASVAAQLGISKRYLHQLISRENTTFSQLLLGIRISHACKLLDNDAFKKLSISEIAFNCGFVDSGHFSRLFKKVMRMTPTGYRQKDEVLGQKGHRV